MSPRRRSSSFRKNWKFMSLVTIVSGMIAIGIAITTQGLAAIVLRQADTRDAILLLAQAALIVIMITILEQRARRE